MLSVPLGNSLRLGHRLIDCTQDNALWRFFNEHRATAFKPQSLTDAYRETHATVRRDVNLECHVSFSALDGISTVLYHRSDHRVNGSIRIPATPYVTIVTSDKLYSH